jgi:hypothetical protein
MALSQLLPNRLTGANVHPVKQPDITAMRNARTAKVSAIFSWARKLKQRFKRRYFHTDRHNVLAKPLTCPTGEWRTMPCSGAYRTRTILGVVVKLVLVMMAVTRAKETPIANRTAERVLKHNKVPEPIGDAVSSRTEELFATAMRTAGALRLRSGFLHDKSSAGGPHVTTF